MGWWSLVVLALAGCDRVFSIDRPDAAPGVWLDSDHVARKELTIAPPSRTPLDDFPVGVVLANDAELAASALPEARDVVFTADDGTTRLEHEIERYAAGSLVAWVRIPRLAGTTRIYLYYGGAPVPDSDVTWSMTFGAVWHMGGAALGIEPDSTPNANTLSAITGAPPAVIDGIAGSAREFDGTNDRLDAAHAASLDAGDGSLCYSLWVRAGAPIDGYDSPLAKGGSQPQFPGYLIQLGADPWTASVADGSVQRQVELGSGTTRTGTWVHLAAVIDRDSGELRAMVDGIQVARTELAPLGSAASPTSALSLSPIYDPFRGVIDEVRIYRQPLPAAWFATEHANLTDPTFLSVGGAETRPGTGI